MYYKIGRAIIIVILIMFIANFANAQQTDQQRLEEYVSTADNYYKNGNYYGAINFYNKAREIYEYADLYYSLCLAYCAIGNENDANNAFEQYKRLAQKGKEKSEKVEKLKQALAKFEKPFIKWKDYLYQKVSSFWSINYSYSPYVPFNYNENIYTGTTMHGVGISIMADNKRRTLLKFETDISFYWGNTVYPYSHYRSSIENLYNVDIKFKGKFFSKKPQFQLGRNIVGRITGSFGVGIGWLSNTDMVLTQYYEKRDDENLLYLLMYTLNNFSYQASIGTFLSIRDKPIGLKIEVFAQGYWQFSEENNFVVPQVGVLVGMTFGMK
ncbi:MAG: tetratricopeptide repeat protein [Bacteroidales bacterium]|jgi:tetratricopeptide (TPR) repeat protein|nr:tetratricopeptide repeat protein [Bacteroidales bacterium]